MRRTLVVLIIVVAAAAGGLYLYKTMGARAAEPQEQREEATIDRGTLISVVNGTGTIVPERQTTLSFQSAGRVARVLVTEGQMVHAGDALAQLDTTDLEMTLSEAQLALSLVQAQSLRAQLPATESDLAAARAAVDSANAAYRRLLAGPTKEEVQVARAGMEQAKAALDQAQMAYNRVADRPDIGMLPESLQLKQATIAYESAKAQFDLTQRKPTAADISAAKSGIAQAEANLARLQAGLTDEDLLIAQIQAKQAQLRVDQAQRMLANATLTAPHDGMITAVGVKEGELAGVQAMPAFVLTDLSAFHAQAMLDEIDVGRLAVGQPVSVTLDALPGEIVRGQVESIANTASVDTGVVTFQVKVHLDPTTAPLRAGMTANLDIVAERRDGVLLVPSRFVRLDRSTGKTFVDRLVAGQVQGVEVQLGLRDEFSSEVLAGLSEGDDVVLIKQSTRDQLRQTFMGGPSQ